MFIIPAHRLRAAPKGDVARAVELSAEDDLALRRAFGRFGGGAEDRIRAAAIVRRFQQIGAGYWFLCGCRPNASPPPCLIPVSQTHIRRHTDAVWPAHAESCDFFRDADEQSAIVQSHSPGSGPLRLVRAFGTSETPLDRRVFGASHFRGRPGIARLLMRLVSEAGLQTIHPYCAAPSLKDQSGALWRKARKIEIEAGLSLADFFGASARDIDDVREKIRSGAQRFRTSRPHGVVIARLASIGKGVLHPVSGEDIPVRGRIAVFAADGEDHARNARAPYLAACVMGASEPGGQVECLSAYAHPMVANNCLMLVDSDFERRTLRQLRSLQRWLGENKGIGLEIEKPVFDIGPDTEVSRPVCMPDFILRDPAQGKIVIVETMGFSGDEYRARKQRTHLTMSAALSGAPVVLHEVNEGPAEIVDTAFWRRLMRMFTNGADRARSVSLGS